MDKDFQNLTIKTYLEKVEKGEINLEDFLNESEKISNKLEKNNIFVEKWFDKAKRNNNKFAIPLGVKDNFLIKDQKMTAASKMLKNFISPYTSTIIERLEPISAFIGSLNMDEFAMGGAGITSCYGPTISPWKNKKNEDMCPGGSSSGSVCAVTSGMCFAALGTDTGGSIRLPAAYNGIVGLKPTYGVFSRYGVVDFASSLDCPGLFTKTTNCMRFMFNSLIGKDPMDFTSVDYIPQHSQKKCGIFMPAGTSEQNKENLKKAGNILEEKGYIVEEIDIEYLEYSISLYYILACAEAASNLSKYDGIFYGGDNTNYKNLDDFYTKTRSENFGEEVQRRIVLGNFVTWMGNVDGFYIKSRKILNKIWKSIQPHLESNDFILMPAAHSSAPTMSEIKQMDPVKIYYEDFYTCFVNLLGIPGMTIPMSLCPETEMPMGIQLVSKPFGENLIFNGAELIEQAVDFRNKYSWNK